MSLESRSLFHSYKSRLTNYGVLIMLKLRLFIIYYKHHAPMYNGNLLFSTFLHYLRKIIIYFSYLWNVINPTHVYVNY